MSWRRKEITKIQRTIRLSKLRQFLMAADHEALHLRNLQPLRKEVEVEYQKIVRGEK